MNINLDNKDIKSFIVVGDRVLIKPRTQDEKTKSGLLAPVIGGKVKKYMTAKIKYTNEPLGKVKVISDFLPSPEELALKDETVKVTIALSKTSVDFFKKEAKKYNTQYQKMIRRLLDEYTAHQL